MNRFVDEVFEDNYYYMIRYLDVLFKNRKKPTNEVFDLVKAMIMRNKTRYNNLHIAGFLFGCITFIYDYLDMREFKSKYGAIFNIISGHACNIIAKEPYEYKNDMIFQIPNFRENSHPMVLLRIEERVYENLLEYKGEISDGYLNSFVNVLAAIIELRYKIDEIIDIINTSNTGMNAKFSPIYNTLFIYKREQILKFFNLEDIMNIDVDKLY